MQKIKRLLFLLKITVVLNTLNAEAGTSYPAPEPSPDASFWGSRIQRTMTLLSTSSEKSRNPVKILFYGQSITARSWWKDVKADLEKRFPHAPLIIENRSIGGHTAPALVRNAVHDLYWFYPDLVVFHVYGGERTGELEQIGRASCRERV